MLTRVRIYRDPRAADLRLSRDRAPADARARGAVWVSFLIATIAGCTAGLWHEICNDIQVGVLGRCSEEFGQTGAQRLQAFLAQRIILTGSSLLLALEDDQDKHACRVLLVLHEDRAEQSRVGLLEVRNCSIGLATASALPSFTRTVLNWAHMADPPFVPRSRVFSREVVAAMTTWPLLQLFSVILRHSATFPRRTACSRPRRSPPRLMTARGPWQ